MNRLDLISKAITNSEITVDNLQTLKVQVTSGVGTIWFNKQKSFNSISFRMAKQFIFLFSYLDDHPKVKVILIKSKHPVAFCVGADIKANFFDENLQKQSSMFVFLERAFRAVRKPIISVVEGLALGGGFQIALLSDIILCSEKASFGLPQIRLGIMPGLGGTQFLPRLVGTKVALQKILTGFSMTGLQAQDLNIAICYPQQNFTKKVDDFVEILLSRASQSMQVAKQAINLSLQTSLEQGLKAQASIIQKVFNKSAGKEGISAFVQKRKPNFRQM